MLLNLLRTLLNPLLRLFGVKPGSSVPHVPFIAPTEYPLPDVPADEAERPIVPPPPTLDVPAPVAAECRATLKQVGTVNIRYGPGLAFEWVERAAGGTTFAVLEISSPDDDGHAWLHLAWEAGEGWVRADLATLTGDCPEPVLP